MWSALATRPASVARSHSKASPPPYVKHQRLDSARRERGKTPASKATQKGPGGSVDSAVTPPKVGKGQKKSPKSGRSSTAEKTAIIPAAQEATASLIVTAQDATTRVTAQEASSIVTGQETTARVTAQEASPIVTGQEATARVTAKEASPIVTGQEAIPESLPRRPAPSSLARRPPLPESLHRRPAPSSLARRPPPATAQLARRAPQATAQLTHEGPPATTLLGNEGPPWQGPLNRPGTAEQGKDHHGMHR
ncbi:hypothetical protein NDU88_004604 [Pleurodeles waltl]|uniref:Uncharacterized protein n=1 Tax=Pleurodeles waltl TaxID=8319 RepID=A0AAV7MTY3_PLEWA|nr:hypothetical protein NDU88_004604 [Pleurodeles waltl]